MDHRRSKIPNRYFRMNGKTMVKQLIISIFIILFVILAKLIDHATVKEGLETIHQQISINYEISDFLEIGKNTFDQLKEGTTTIVATLANGGKLTNFTPPSDVPGTFAVSATTGEAGYSMEFSKGEELQVYAISGGTVAEIVTVTDQTNYIKVTHGNGIFSLYGGCTDIYVDPLEKVRKGQIIGSVAPGQNPLLFELWVDGALVDPTDYIEF